MSNETFEQELIGIASRLAACLWDYHSTCPECGNSRKQHLPGCAQTYEREFTGPQDTKTVFEKAFKVKAALEKGAEPVAWIFYGMFGKPSTLGFDDDPHIYPICKDKLYTRPNLPPSEQDELERPREFSEQWHKNVAIADLNAQHYFDRMTAAQAELEQLRAENAALKEERSFDNAAWQRDAERLRVAEQELSGCHIEIAQMGIELAALRQRVVPEGWVPVPKEPTEPMLHAAKEAYRKWNSDDTEVRNPRILEYHAMLAAAQGEQK